MLTWKEQVIDQEARGRLQVELGKGEAKETEVGLREPRQRVKENREWS